MSDTPNAEQAVLDGIGKLFRGYVSGRDVQDAAYRDQIADLQAQLDEQGGGGAAVTVFGSSNAGSLPAGVELPAGRVYVSSGKKPTSWTQLPGDQRDTIARSTQQLVLSWKEAPGSWLWSLLDSIKKDRPDLIVNGCQNHEPFDNFTTAAGVAEYHKRWDAAVPPMREHGVLPTTILDGSHPESWDDFARDDVVCNGIDRYNPGIQNPKSYTAPADVYGPYFDWLASDFGALIGETGTGRTPTDATGSGQLSWTLAARAYLASQRMAGPACWWSQGGCTLTPQLAQAWLEGQS